MSASADVISVEIAGPVLSARRKFLMHRRDRHARNTAREPALICASSEINPFYPERDSISIFPLVATRKIFTAPGQQAKNESRAEREEEGERGRAKRKTRRNSRYNELEREREREGESERLISRVGVTKIMKISAPR